MIREKAIEILKRKTTIPNDGEDFDDISDAFNMAIASLEAWGEIKQEINDLFSKPACYMPNYDAYKMFLKIIDRHLQEVQDADNN